MAEGKKFNGLPDATGFEAPKFIYEKQRKYVRSRRAALRNTTSKLNPLNLFIGIHSCPLPCPDGHAARTYFCLLNSTLGFEF